MLRPLPLCLSLLLLTQCSQKKHDPAPANRLPPATQTGAGTFGCLVNGQVYTPKGNNGTPNFAVLYEPGLQGANLNIAIYRIDDTRRHYLNLACGLVTAQRRTFDLSLASTEGMAHYSGSAGYYDNDNGLKYRQGQLVITRLDERAGIISGTFAFTSVNLKGDTLKVTQGRFDSKL